MRGPGGLMKALGVTAIIVLFLLSTVVFTPAFRSQPVTDQIAAFAGLFVNFYLLSATAVVLGWFVYRYFIWPRLRYNQLRRIRAARKIERIQ